MLRRNMRGDTIVEVLISLAVLTTVLLGAYTTANRSQTNNQASQERGEAIKLAESQIEGLKSLISRGSSFSDADKVCVKSDNPGFSTALTSNPFGQSLETDTFPYDPGECGNLSGRYNVAIKKTGNNYEFLVRWDRAGGRRDQINMYYRTYGD